MAAIELCGVSKRFGTTLAVDDLSIKIDQGEFCVVLGPSGAGKTTTLRLVAGLEHPDAGSVRMDGQAVNQLSPAQRNVAFVFQQYSLYPHMTVFENLAFPLRSPLHRQPEDEIRRRVSAIAELLRISGKLERKATQLSGGEMQRVAIGRALVRRPEVFLMDEPLSSLDAKLREELRVELRRIQRDTGATFLYVTHDQVEASTMADRIVLLDHGRVLQAGSPEHVYANPQSLSVAQRLGSPVINVLPVSATDTCGAPGAAWIAIRPEDVMLVPAGIEYQVLEHSRVKQIAVLVRDQTELRMRLLDDTHLHPGQTVHVHLPVERCLYFDETGNRLRH